MTTVSTIHETRTCSWTPARTAVAQPAEQPRTEAAGFTAEATSLVVNDGVRSVLLDMLGETEETKPVGIEPAPVSDTEKYRALIAADIKTAYGREATDEDYTYWLGKLEGPNDSSFVTSGQMTATEYWHRRMLGWQAGGSDVALYGPYAGGAQGGDVAPATDVVPGIAPGGVYNQASPERIAWLRNLIATDIRTAYGREATEQDYGYWLPRFLGPNDSGFVTSGSMSSDEYWHRRLLGWQAGGADVALYGPYAGGAAA